ncbi:Pyocin activator protein PrtN [Halopseudomonas formosensis]|jgi:hypothetical protein|uniref:Pyocin activator protein PrtN n=1 Tax=Halopseudomonas formosensis TaxID=1002526 RepID=A0A1I6APC0_9GAMM|nr:pyocin activator PrtN family protein [Halopseudomonas formosensis]SFQ70427.1 Pyocin activator protein PrtN [Halopseudomonas formosensis]
MSKATETATLQQLQRRYTRPYVTLAELRADHLPHIQTDKHLLREVAEGRIKIKISRLHRSNRAPRVVTLPDLAAWLDQQLVPGNTNAADAA